MFKKIGISFLIGIMSVVAYILGCRINRGRVSDNNISAGNLRRGIDSSGKRNTEIRETIGRTGKRVSNARAQLRSAIEILRAAKKTS